MTSSGESAAFVSASAPLSAVTTEWPRAPRPTDKTRRSAGSSSTTRILDTSPPSAREIRSVAQAVAGRDATAYGSPIALWMIQRCTSLTGVRRS